MDLTTAILDSTLDYASKSVNAVSFEAQMIPVEETISEQELIQFYDQHKLMIPRCNLTARSNRVHLQMIAGTNDFAPSLHGWDYQLLGDSSAKTRENESTPSARQRDNVAARIDKYLYT